MTTAEVGVFGGSGFYSFRRRFVEQNGYVGRLIRRTKLPTAAPISQPAAATTAPASAYALTPVPKIHLQSEHVPTCRTVTNARADESEYADRYPRRATKENRCDHGKSNAPAHGAKK